MSLIRVHDKLFEPFINREELETRVNFIAEQINTDFSSKKPLFIAILNGSFIFASDLFKKLTIEAEICFIKLASYKGSKSTGNVVTAIGLDADVYGRNVVIVEDIVDTGKTLTEFLPQLRHQHPASMKIVALLHKAEAMVHPVEVDYLGFTIPDKFVVGYGLDYNGFGRNIPEIYKLVE